MTTSGRASSRSRNQGCPKLMDAPQEARGPELDAMISGVDDGDPAARDGDRCHGVLRSAGPTPLPGVAPAAVDRILRHAVPAVLRDEEPAVGVEGDGIRIFQVAHAARCFRRA